MKEENAATTSTMKMQSSESSNLFGGKGGYKFWALAAILLLAFWSMFTGSVTLKWSASNLSRFSDDIDSSIHDDLDVLEVEEREKLVRYMWDVYTHTTTARLPRFWEEAFEAAYMELASDVPSVRNAAVSEIAKMSLLSFHLHPLSLHSTVCHKKSCPPENLQLVISERLYAQTHEYSIPCGCESMYLVIPPKYTSFKCDIVTFGELIRTWVRVWVKRNSWLLTVEMKDEGRRETRKKVQQAEQGKEVSGVENSR